MAKTAPRAPAALTVETAPIRPVPLALLDLSPLNPRRAVDEAYVAALATSIRSIGLLHDIAGFETEDGRVAIVPGGCRLRALRRIADEDGADPAAVMIPVRMARDEAEAEAWGRAENVARRAMSPADEIANYAAMVESGASVETVARAFAVTVRHVKGRLRLAGLHPDIMAALREGAITLDAASAYTVTGDRAVQAVAFKRLQGGWNGDNPAAIRRAMMQEAESAEGRLARLVGREAYEAAGGAVREDLFSEDVWFLDGALLAELAAGAVARAGEAVAAEGWAWIDARMDRPGYEETARLSRAYPVQAEISERDAERHDALAARIEAGEADEAETAEFEALEAALDAEIWTDAQKAHAGAFVYVDGDGAVAVLRGMVKPEHREAAVAAGVIPAAPVAPHRAKPQGPYPAALAADLASIRTGAVQAALLKKPELALDLLAFVLSTPLYDGASPLEVRAGRPVNAPENDPGMALPEALTHGADAPPLDAAEAAARFAAFRAKPKRERNAALTRAIAAMLRARLALDGANPLLEAVAEAAGADVRAVWTPTTAFFKRLKAEQLDAVAAHVYGRATPVSFAKLRKGDKVARLHALFNNPADRKGMAHEAVARIAAWTPEGMAATDEPVLPADDAVEGNDAA